MKYRLLCTLGLIVLGMVVFGISPAEAGPKAPAGPYYAQPSWDQTLPATTRYIVLSNMGGNAVLDQETGLVWEQSPSTSGFAWEDAQTHCNQLTTGGRLGWRLPTLQELTSLADPTQSFALPPGHPFQNVQFNPYWSATSSASSPGAAWTVTFNGIELTITNISAPQNVWCVRGGQGVDHQ